MTLTWGEFRTRIRTTILQDAIPDEEDGLYRWSDDEMLYALEMALDQFANHTAQATGTGFSPSEDNTYALPENMIGEPLELSGSVTVTEGSTVSYLDPIRLTPEYEDANNASGFWTHPQFTLHLTDTYGESAVINVEYFAHYNVPSSDLDTIDVPRWARACLMYATGIHLLAGSSLKTSLIRQWNSRVDSGSPTTNPILQQQEVFIKMYERELSKYKPQARINHFRTRQSL